MVDEVSSKSLEDAKAFDWDPFYEGVKEWNSLLGKLKRAPVEGAADAGQRLEATMEKFEAFVIQTLAPDYESQLLHIQKFAEDSKADPETTMIKETSEMPFGIIWQVSILVTKFGRWHIGPLGSSFDIRHIRLKFQELIMIG